jgi:hypothetical protein
MQRIARPDFQSRAVELSHRERRPTFLLDKPTWANHARLEPPWCKSNLEDPYSRSRSRH